MKQITIFLTTLLFCTFIGWSQSIQHPTLELLKILEADINTGIAGQLNTLDSDLDSAGNLIIIGTFNAVIDMDPSSGMHTLNANPSPPNGQNTLLNRSSYIAKYSPSGALIWAYKLGEDSNISIVSNINVDTKDNINIVGKYKYSVDFDLWDSQYILNSPNSSKTFVVSYKPNGQLNWVNDIDLGPSGYSMPRDIDFKTDGRIVVAGKFNGQIIFPTSLSQITLTNSGENNAFLAELNSKGHWISARHVPNVHEYSIESIAIDSNNNVICNIRESGGSAGPLVYSITIRRYFDSNLGFEDIIKLVPENFNTSLTFGAMDIDYKDNIYFGGRFNVPVYLNGSLFLSPSNNTSSPDTYMIKINNSNTIVWTKTFTPIVNPAYVSYLAIHNLKVDKSNRLMLTGAIRGDFNIGNNTTFSSDIDPSENNTHIMKFNQDGSPIWSYALQPAGVASIHMYNDEFYIYGKLSSLTDFDLHPTGNTTTNVDNNDPDIFMAKYHDVTIDTFGRSNVLLESFEIYPTVISDFVIIDNKLNIEGQHVIEIYDLLGNLKMQMDMLDSKVKNKMHITNLKSGIYVLKIKSIKGGFIQSSKLIKK